MCHSTMLTNSYLTLIIAPLLLGHASNLLAEAARGGAKCPKLKKPENGQIVGTCRKFVGEQCEFACRAPYVLVGSQFRICQNDGIWSGTPAYCELSSCNNCQTQCLPMNPPANGRSDGACNPGIPGENCYFYCNSGYYLTGSPTMTCLTNGLWSGQTPRCNRAGCSENFGNLGNNMQVQCQNRNGVRVCTFSCRRGFRLIGNSVVTCYNQNGWSGEIPRCQRISNRNCATLIAPANGVVSGQCSPGIIGRWCNLTCNEGYRPFEGSTRLLCMVNGEWTGQFPQCQRVSEGQCPTLGGIQNGIMSGTCAPGRIGQICSFSCYSGFQLIGSPTLICQQNGQWSSSVPRCRSTACPTLVPPRDGSLTGTCSGAHEGDSCRFTCANNYQILGDSVLVCTSSGTWSNSVPVCRGQTGCAALNPPANGIFTQCDNGVGSQCIVSCNQGYARSGSEVRVCQQNGRWSGTAPTCRRVVGFRVVPLWTLIFG